MYGFTDLPDEIINIIAGSEHRLIIRSLCKRTHKAINNLAGVCKHNQLAIIKNCLNNNNTVDLKILLVNHSDPVKLWLYLWKLLLGYCNYYNCSSDTDNSNTTDNSVTDTLVNKTDSDFMPIHGATKNKNGILEHKNIKKLFEIIYKFAFYCACLSANYPERQSSIEFKQYLDLPDLFVNYLHLVNCSDRYKLLVYNNSISGLHSYFTEHWWSFKLIFYNYFKKCYCCYEQINNFYLPAELHEYHIDNTCFDEYSYSGLQLFSYMIRTRMMFNLWIPILKKILTTEAIIKPGSKIESILFSQNKTQPDYNICKNMMYISLDLMLQLKNFDMFKTNVEHDNVLYQQDSYIDKVNSYQMECIQRRHPTLIGEFCQAALPDTEYLTDILDNYFNSDTDYYKDILSSSPTHNIDDNIDNNTDDTSTMNGDELENRAYDKMCENLIEWNYNDYDADLDSINPVVNYLKQIDATEVKQISNVTKLHCDDTCIYMPDSDSLETIKQIITSQTNTVPVDKILFGVIKKIIN